MTDKTPEPRISATAAEGFAWTIFAVAAIVAFVAGIAFGIEQNSYYGNPAVPLVWMSVGVALAGLTLVPALLLAGQRELLVQRLALRARPVDHADTAADDAHDGRGHAAGGEHLAGDIR